MPSKEYLRLKEVIELLRDPQKGCPWDLKQTHESLLKYLLEETYEFIHAVENKDFKAMEEELGDVLLQVFLHSLIAQEKGEFNIESVCKILADKMIRRHPHVFSETKKLSINEVLDNWETIKKTEKSDQGHTLDESYLMFSALTSAQKIGEKTHEIKFDWNETSQVAYKVEEEWQELKEEILPTVNSDKAHEEFGDLLFSLVQLGRHLGFDAENSLRSANKKFLKRFQEMENLIKEAGLQLEKMDQEGMDVYWNKAKKKEREVGTL